MSDILALDLHGAIAIVVRTLVVYVALLAMLRVLGKRHVGQLSLFDFVLVLLISNAVQNAMVGPDSSLTGGLLAAVVLVAMNALLSRFAIGHKHFGALLEGEPTLLIRDGRVLPSHLAREGMAPADLEAAVREHGIASSAEVRQAILEIDGSVSVIAKDGQGQEHRLPPVRRRHMKSLRPGGE